MDETLQWRGAEIGRRLGVIGRQLLQVGENRQRQQHDEEMHEADDGGAPRIGQLYRLRNKSDVHQRRIDNALLRQHQKPGIGAHHIGRPERQHRQHQRQPLPAFRDHKSQDPCKRIGQQHRNHGDHGRHLERVGQRPPVARIDKKLRVVGEAQAISALGVKAGHRHGHKRHAEKDQRPQHCRCDAGPADTVVCGSAHCACSISVHMSCIFLSRSSEGAG